MKKQKEKKKRIVTHAHTMIPTMADWLDRPMECSFRIIVHHKTSHYFVHHNYCTSCLLCIILVFRCLFALCMNAGPAQSQHREWCVFAIQMDGFIQWRIVNGQCFIANELNVCCAIAQTTTFGSYAMRIALGTFCVSAQYT